MSGETWTVSAFVKNGEFWERRAAQMPADRLAEQGYEVSPTARERIRAAALRALGLTEADAVGLQVQPHATPCWARRIRSDTEVPSAFWGWTE